MHTKRFLDWITVKANLHFGEKSPSILEGEVWWCSIGENIGSEINGKGPTFTRPTLIMKKLSYHSFMGIPLSSKENIGSWYVRFSFHDTTQTAVLSQARTMNTSRLHSKIGRIPERDLVTIRQAFINLYG